MDIPVKVTQKIWSDALEAEGEPVLLCSCTLPEVSRLESAPAERINRYYARLEERFRRWCHRTLLPRAARLRQEARSRSRPFDPWRAELSFESTEEDEILTISITYSRKAGDCILYSSVSEKCWDRKTGFLLCKTP